MEVNESNLMVLCNCLQQTLSADVNIRRPSEKNLEAIEGNPNYPVLLLTLINKPDLDPVIRIAGAISFKNFIKRNWRPDDDGPDKIRLEDRLTIKNMIIGMMLNSPAQIQKQLSDAVSIIGREDFPEKWPNLLDEMVNHMHNSGGDFNIINGVLQTAHSLFKRYRHEFKSNELWTEIKYVLERFAKPFTDLFVATIDLAKAHGTSCASLKTIFSSLVLSTKIFHSLNAQDLPEFFEDNIAIWMDNFLALLSVDNKFLVTDNEEEAGLLEQLKSQICDNIGMYAQKYHEEFEPYLPRFVQEVWTLLINTGSQPKYDLLVSNAIHFLSTVADRPQYQKLFSEPGVLDSLCSKVIIPNMQFRQSDEEMFEDNPEEYIRRDIEGSDIDTRRRASCDLVKSLSRYFEAQIIQVFSQYIQTMLTDFASNPNEKWKSKDAAIYLVTSMAVKGSTTRLGTTQTSELVNVLDFYQNFIKSDLEQNPDLTYLPVLRADALKYLMTFKNQLPLNEYLIPAIPTVIKHLRCPSIVVHTYAAHTLERFFFLREPNTNSPAIKPIHLQSCIEPLLKGLFGTLNMTGSSENEYVMKAIMRSFSLLQEYVLPYLPELIPTITQKIRDVSKNPSKPHFNHYLFEALCLAIKIACQKDKSSVTAFESHLFPVFEQILVQDCQEFMPYIFQVLSLLLEVHRDDPNPSAPQVYMTLFPCLLAPVLWDRPANIHPLVRLLRAFVETNSMDIVTMGKLQGLLGVFQKLMASKSNDHEGFYLIQSIIEHVSSDELAKYIKEIFVLLFQRLTSSKTTKYVKGLIVYFSLFVVKYGAQSLVQTIDSIQAKMFGMVLERLFITDVQKVSGKLERKICAVGITKILCETPEIIQGQYSNLWGPLLTALIALIELPEDETIPNDEHFIEIEDTPGYQASYAQLIFCSKKEKDPLADYVEDERRYLAQSLQKLSMQYPGAIPQLIQTSLQADAATIVQKYCNQANVVLA